MASAWTVISPVRWKMQIWCDLGLPWRLMRSSWPWINPERAWRGSDAPRRNQGHYPGRSRAPGHQSIEKAIANHRHWLPRFEETAGRGRKTCYHSSWITGGSVLLKALSKALIVTLRLMPSLATLVQYVRLAHFEELTRNPTPSLQIDSRRVRGKPWIYWPGLSWAYAWLDEQERSLLS